MALDIETIIWCEDETVRGRGYPDNMYGKNEPLNGQDEADAIVQGCLIFKLKDKAGMYVLTDENNKRDHFNIVKIIKKHSKKFMQNNLTEWYIYEDDLFSTSGDFIYLINKILSINDLCLLNDSLNEGWLA